MEPALSEVEGAGIFDFDLTNQGQIKIKIPTLHKERGKGGAPDLKISKKTKAASFSLTADG
jgi:hypothetical protein